MQYLGKLISKLKVVWSA